MSETTLGGHRTSASVSRSGDRYFLVMSALLLAFAVLGFLPSFYLRQWLWPDVFNGRRHGPTLPPHLYAHGAALTAWFVLAFAQACLVAARRTPLHRRLGVAGIAIAVAVVATSVVTTAVRDVPVLSDQPMRSLPQLLTVSTFALCVTAGALLRREPATHKRLMLIASLAVVGPGVSRLLSNVGVEDFSVGSGVLILTMLATIPARDLITQRRVHRGTLIGLSLVASGVGIAFLVTGTGLWVSLARVLV